MQYLRIADILNIINPLIPNLFDQPAGEIL